MQLIFGFDASFGEKVKFGVKFGSTIKEVLNVSNTITKTLGGDELGEVIINFADPVVISDEFRYHYKPRTNPREQAVVDYTEPTFNSKYYTGWYRLYISPKKTNFINCMRVYQNSNLMAMNLQSENCLFLFIIKKEPCHYPLISLIRLFCAYSL